MSNFANWFSIKHLKLAPLWLTIGFGLIALICYLSLTTLRIPLANFINGDKLLHLIAYAALMGWFIQIFHHRWGRLVIAVLFISFGVGMEFLQGMHPHRYFDVMDMLANTVGILLAWAAGFTWLDSILLWFERASMKLFQHH